MAMCTIGTSRGTHDGGNADSPSFADACIHSHPEILLALLSLQANTFEVSTAKLEAESAAARAKLEEANRAAADAARRAQVRGHV